MLNLLCKYSTELRSLKHLPTHSASNSASTRLLNERGPYQSQQETWVRKQRVQIWPRNDEDLIIGDVKIYLRNDEDFIIGNVNINFRIKM